MNRGHFNLFHRWQDRKKDPRAADRPVILARLLDQQATLQTAMQSAENEFLALGRQMEGMSQTSEAIASLASEILQATSGTGDKGALCQATRTLDNVFTRAESKQSHYAKIQALLR